MSDAPNSRTEVAYLAGYVTMMLPHLGSLIVINIAVSAVGALAAIATLVFGRG